MPSPRPRFTVRRLMIAVTGTRPASGTAAAPRFTVRRLMIAVTVVAVLLSLGIGTMRLKRLSDRYNSLANYYASDTIEPVYKQARPLSETRKRWQSDLESKYRRAARYPFLPVAPDPPKPE